MTKEELVKKLKNGDDVDLEVRHDTNGYAILTWQNDRIDLTDSDLSGIDFSNKRLSYVDFTGSKLDGVKFNNCNIRTCKFDDCIIENTSFDTAIIDNTVMDNVTMSKTSFVDTAIYGIKITRGLLAGLDFSRLFKTKAICLEFYDTEILKCCFDNIQARIDIDCCVLKKCTFNGTVFVDPSLSADSTKNFVSSYIENTSFNKANLYEYNNIFNNSILLDINMYEVYADYLEIQNASLRNVDISDAKIDDSVQFNNCSIVNLVTVGASGSMTFDNSNLSNGIMTGMNMTNLKFKNSYAVRTNLDNSYINNWFISMSTFKLCHMDNMIINNLNVEKPVAFLVDDEFKFTWAKNKHMIDVIEWVDGFDEN